jgi:DNA-binding MarR family transcriptional regulator
MQAHERLFKLLMSDRAQVWRDVDLTIQQVKTLLLIVREGSVTAGQISRQLRVGFSTVTGLVDRLAEQGLIERGEDPRDRRATRVIPTDAGRALVEELYSYRRDGLSRVLDRVSTEALAQYATGLAALEAAAQLVADERRADAPD